MWIGPKRFPSVCRQMGFNLGRVLNTGDKLREAISGVTSQSSELRDLRNEIKTGIQSLQMVHSDVRRHSPTNLITQAVIGNDVGTQSNLQMKSVSQENYKEATQSSEESIQTSRGANASVQSHVGQSNYGINYVNDDISDGDVGASIQTQMGTNALNISRDRAFKVAVGEVSSDRKLQYSPGLESHSIMSELMLRRARVYIERDDK